MRFGEDYRVYVRPGSGVPFRGGGGRDKFNPFPTNVENRVSS